MSRRRARTAALLSVVGIAGLSACGPTQGSAACVDWAHYATPADATTDADAVALGTVTAQTGTTDLYGHDAHVWRVEVDHWLQGSGDPVIEVVSTPRTCETGSPYPDGDPLDGADDVALLLTADGGRWLTLTGYQGVLPDPSDGGLPTGWPESSP